MPELKRIVTNTSPLIALVAALGDLKVLSTLFDEVLVPFEVCQEITADNASRFGAFEFGEADWLKKQNQSLVLSPFLANALDRGEASVIQLALNESIKTVCIDEALGRRIARLSGLSLTGSLGILIRAKREGYPLLVRDSIQRMQAQGIRLSPALVQAALTQAGE